MRLRCSYGKIIFSRSWWITMNKKEISGVVEREKVVTDVRVV
jgi:hypothetical protein